MPGMEHSGFRNKKAQLEKGQRVALFSTLLILALALLKAGVGYFFNSSLLIADAWHSGADILINLSSLIGLKLAAKKKSDRFPFGLYKAETIACLLIGTVIAFIGADMLQQGWHKLFSVNSGTQFPFFPVAASAVSCAVALILALKQKATGIAIGSQALLATASEAFFDIFTSFFVLIGIICVYFSIAYIEGIIIIIIALLILKLGAGTAWKSIMILMDADMDTELKHEIKEKLKKIHGIKSVDEVRIRQSGPFKIVNCIIRTDPSITLYKSHDLADTAENLLLMEYQNIDSVFIHVEPEKSEICRIAVPVSGNMGLDSIIHPHFARAPWFMILTLENGRIRESSFLANEFLDKKGHIGLNTAKLMINLKVSLLFVRRIGEISFHMLKDHYIAIFRVEKDMSVDRIISMYCKGSIQPMTQPESSRHDFEF
jgi:cation diffusion facilitator family transporter